MHPFIIITYHTLSNHLTLPKAGLGEAKLYWPGQLNRVYCNVGKHAHLRCILLQTFFWEKKKALADWDDLQDRLSDAPLLEEASIFQKRLSLMESHSL